MEQKIQHPEYQYIDLLKKILKEGTDKKLFFAPEILEWYKKKGEDPPTIRSIFGYSMRFNVGQYFPLLTTKKVFFRGILEELLWFLRGYTNIKYLVDRNVHIWDEWAWKRYRRMCGERGLPDMEQKEFIEKIASLPENDPFVVEWGDLIVAYGKMWRRWPASDGRAIDQLGWVIEGLRKMPYRKSYVVSAWNPDFIYEMASKGNDNDVPPFCHTTFQFAVTGDGILNLGLYQRSADVFLGLPFNIASYALLLRMVAHITGLKPGDFFHTLGDAHIYSNHFEQVREQLSREPKPFPQLSLSLSRKNIDDFVFEDFSLDGYDPHPAIRAEIANIGGFERKK